MGHSSSQPYLTKIAWNMRENPVKKTFFSLPKGTNQMKIILPLTKKHKVITLKSDKDGFVPMIKIMTEIHNVYKNEKNEDHVFFEGLNFTKTHGTNAIYTVLTGS